MEPGRRQPSRARVHGAGKGSVLQFRFRRASPAILIISDNPSEPLYVSPFLSQPNLRLMLAPANESGLQTARRIRPKLIIEELTPMDDLGLCKQLRDDPKTGSIPLILITSGQPGSEVGETHADALLPKPLSRQAFFDAVKKFVPMPHRQTERVGVNLRFAFTQGDRAGQLFSRDVSGRGAFLKSDCLPRLGDRLSLSFRLPGAWDEIRCRALVRSIAAEPGPGRCRGFGIEFEDLGEDDRESLEHFIDRYRPSPRTTI